MREVAENSSDLFSGTVLGCYGQLKKTKNEPLYYLVGIPTRLENVGGFVTFPLRGETY